MIIIFTIGFGIDKWGNDCTIPDEVPSDHRPLVNAKNYDMLPPYWLVVCVLYV